MEIRISPEREAQLTALAHEQGRAPADLAGEAIAAWLDSRGWIESAQRKIEEGWQQSERGEVVDGESSQRRLSARHAQLIDAARRR